MPSPPPAPQPVPQRSRLLAVDAARGLALLGMMAVHLLPSLVPAGDGSALQHESWVEAVAGGRASALFAVLAGVALALAHGGQVPPSGTALAASRRAVLARGAVVGVVGLTLGLVPGGIYVILLNYGLLFAVSSLALGWRPRTLATTGAAWLVGSPVASHLLRAHLAAGSLTTPSWAQLLADPAQLAVELLVTGIYPVATWTGYLLVGLAVGRVGASRLVRPRLAAGLLLGGAAVAVVVGAASDALVRVAGGASALLATMPATYPAVGWGLVDVATPAAALQVGLRGVTPTTTWWWLVVDSPHSGTPFDLVGTTASALAVLGAVLLLSGWRAALLAPLAAAGSMTLTLYCAHVLLAPPAVVALGPAAAWCLHAVGAVGLAWPFWRQGLRGPLEDVAARCSRLAVAGSAPRRRRN